MKHIYNTTPQFINHRCSIPKNTVLLPSVWNMVQIAPDDWQAIFVEVGNSFPGGILA